MPDQLILAASHKSPQNVAVPDMPLDLTGQLAKDLLDLTARLGARAEQDPFGNPVLLVALAISRRMDTHTLTEPDIATLIRHLRDAAFADRARAARRLCGRYRHAAERRRAGRSGAASAAARPERQPGALGRISRAGGTHALRRGVHRAPDLRAAARRPATPWPRPPAAAPPPGLASHRPPPISLARASSRRPPPRSPTAVTRWTGSMRRCCRSRAPPGRTAGPNCAAPGDPVELGRLRHRRTHRYRLVGHAAAATGDEAPAARAAARARSWPCRGPSRSRRASAAAQASGRPHRSHSAPTRRTRHGSPPLHRRWSTGATTR